MSAHAPPPKLVRIMVRLFLIVVVLAVVAIDPTLSNILKTQPTSPTQDEGYYPVVHVVDGDTLDITKNGATERVRLLGINTPESVGDRPAECFGKEASNRLKEIANGADVRLEFDSSQSLTDKYGRLLAYLYTHDGQMINRKLINEGYAFEYTYMKPYKYQKEFREAQSFAKNTQAGLWSPRTCNGQK